MPATITLLSTPIPIHGVTAPGYGAIDMRRALGFGAREGVLDANSLKVIQRAAGAAMAVDMLAGEALIQGDSVANQGLYHAFSIALNTANELTVAAAHASLPRVDRVVLAVNDALYDGSGQNRGQVRVLTGTATASANLNNLLGAPSVPASAILLADILVPAASSSVVTANIQDRRPLATTSYDIGDVKFTAGSTVPPGWTAMDAKALSRVVFADLFARTSTTHGAGDGTTTFNVPDLRGRGAIGAGTGPSLTARTLGQKGGSETHTLTEAELPAHVHSVPLRSAALWASGSQFDSVVSTGLPQAPQNTASAGGGQAHNNVPPFAVLTPLVYHGMAQ